MFPILSTGIGIQSRLHGTGNHRDGLAGQDDWSAVRVPAQHLQQNVSWWRSHSGMQALQHDRSVQPNCLHLYIHKTTPHRFSQAIINYIPQSHTYTTRHTCIIDKAKYQGIPTADREWRLTLHRAAKKNPSPFPIAHRKSHLIQAAQPNDRKIFSVVFFRGNITAALRPHASAVKKDQWKRDAKKNAICYRDKETIVHAYMVYAFFAAVKMPFCLFCSPF